jgi:type II secretory ATPase GspE/PulE/Tfp pilus assembly ATPase PilB-like protein
MIPRLLVLLLLVLAVWTAAASPALCQDKGSSGEGWAGPGYYLNWIKLAACWLVFLAWVGTTDWVSRDAVETRMDYLRWNPAVFGTFLAALVLSWLIPLFWIGFPLLVLAHLVPLTAYIVVRNQHVEEHRRVMTPAHLRAWFAERLGRMGVKMEAEKGDPFESGPVVLRACNGVTDRENAAWQFAARQNPGLLTAQTLVTDALSRRADAVMLDYSQQGVGVRFLIDGLWQNGEPMDRETADPMLEGLKVLCGLKPGDRQSRQEGKFAVEYSVFRSSVFRQVEKAKEAYRAKITPQVARELASPETNVTPAELEQRVKLVVQQRTREYFASPIGTWTPVLKTDLSKLKYAGRINPENSVETMNCAATLISQGTATGERALLQLEIKKTRFSTLDEIGMRPKVQEQLKELMHRDAGVLLFSAPPGMGLRTTMNVVLRSADRFSSEFAAVEEEHNRYEEVENVPVTTYNAAAGQTPVSILKAFFHQEPHKVVIRDLVNAETLQMCLDEVANNRLFLTTIRAKDCVEAIYRVLALGVPPADFAKGLLAVFNQRLVRKLCENCKEAYTPTPQVLSQLGIPAGKVQVFFRPPQQRQQGEPVCPECSGVGYAGRTAIFELLLLDDGLRGLLASGATADAVRQAARKAGNRGLQEEGIVLVAKGVTSLPELVRVMKQ